MPLHLSEREQELPEAVISKLIKIVAEDKQVASLGAGEPNFPLQPELVEYLTTLASCSNHYSAPGGREELRQAIVSKLKKENNIKTEPHNIIVTCGSQEALLLASACTLDVSEQVILPNPSFLAYLPMMELLNADAVMLPLHEEDNWEIDPDQLRLLIDKKKTKAIMLNTPSNPTGTVYSKKLLEEIADIARENNLYIFSDEAYEHMVYDKKHVSIGSLNGMEKHVVSFFTFSKSYAMCGFRVGYCAGPSLLIEAMKKVHVYTTICAPTISQLLAVKALEVGKNYTEMMRKAYLKRRNFIWKRLTEIGLPTVKPEGAFYTFSNIKEYSENSFQFAFDLLKKAKVAVVPGKEFGVYGEGYIRCSYATDLQIIEKAMDRLEGYLKKR